jgi:hypothetical protein
MLPGLLTAVALSLAPSPSADTALEAESQHRWEDDGFYFGMGVAPATTLRVDGFNPMIRYDVELGMRWTKGRSALSVGAQPWLLQRLEAPGVGGGLHGVLTGQYGPVYARTGLGVLAGVPRSASDRDSRTALSWMGGLGLESRGDQVRGRIGVDYVATYDKGGRINNSVFLVLAIRFG